VRAVLFPKWESLKNKSGKNGKFSNLKKEPSTYQVSPAIHHKFTIEKPRLCTPFLPKPPAKTLVAQPKKIVQKRWAFLPLF
jgi:hypothetical protein